MQVAQGTYTGDGGATKAITGLGFSPDYVLISTLDTAQAWATHRSSVANSDYEIAGAAGHIDSLDADGFTVDSGYNATSRVYHYLAIEEEAGYCKVGAYTGNGVDNTNISGVGFQPDFVVVWRGSGAAFWTSAKGGDASKTWNGAADWVTDHIQGVHADGFQIGASGNVNSNGIEHYYLAIKVKADNVSVGTYTGNATDNRNITASLDPLAVLLVGAGARETRFGAASVAADNTMSMRPNTWTASANMIQSLGTGEFQIGTDDKVNASGINYYWIALNGAPATPIASSENAAINVTETPTVEAFTAIAGSENAAINVTETSEVLPHYDTSENAAISVTEAAQVQKFSEWIEPASERVRVDLYSSAGAKLAVEPVLDILSCSYQQALNSIGAFSFDVPADGISAGNLAAGQQAWFYVKDEGLVFKGILDKLETVAADSGFVLRVSGSSLARKLVWSNTLIGRKFDNVTLASAMSTLLSGTGFSSGSLATPSTNLYARYDGLSTWAAILKAADTFGLLVREDLWAAEVDVNSFGTNPNNLVFANVPEVTPELAENVNFAPIHSARVIAESTDIWNKVVPVGQDQGIAGNQLTLEDSDRSSPYTVQNASGPDGALYYYLRDATSATAYGERTKVLAFKDVVPQGIATTDFTRAANALYDLAATWLTRHKDPVTSYEIQPLGLTHVSAGSPRFQVGDKVRVIYRGVASRFDGVTTWLNIDTSLFIMGYTRSFDADGRDSWRFTVNTVARDLLSAASLTASFMESVYAMEVAPLPFVLFGDNVARLSEAGLELVAASQPTVSGETDRKVAWTSADFATRYAEVFGSYYSALATKYMISRVHDGTDAYHVNGIIKSNLTDWDAVQWISKIGGGDLYPWHVDNGSTPMIALEYVDANNTKLYIRKGGTLVEVATL